MADQKTAASVVQSEEYKERYGFNVNVEYDDFEKGLSEDVVRKISEIKGEPDWMLEKRLTALRYSTASLCRSGART